jgi:O-methyltransferase involved in polyketide biosynthesis
MGQEQTTETTSSYDKISPTAKYAAHLRAMTDIPYSKEIASVCNVEEAFLNIAGATTAQLTWSVPLVEARYKSINALLDNYSLKNIFELASGLSPRGLMMTEDPRICFIESDLPGLMQEKEKILQKILSRRGEPKRPNLHCCSVDALNREQFFSAVEHFSGGGPIGVICEALLNYLTLQEKQRVAENISALLSRHGGVWITPDISTKDRRQEVVHMDEGTKKTLGLLAGFTGRDLAKNSFDDIHHVKSFFEGMGFTIEEHIQGELVHDLCFSGLPPEQVINIKKLLQLARIWTIKMR